MTIECEAFPVTTFQRSESVVFLHATDRFGKLSNLARGLPIQAFGMTVPSSEALYQAMRFPHCPEIQSRILAAATPKEAKRTAYAMIEETRTDWADIRVPVMAWCVRLKLISNPVAFGRVLDATGNRRIVEESARDNFWGAIPCGPEDLVGRNVLGRLLEVERNAMRQRGLPRLEDAAPGFKDAVLMGNRDGAWDRLGALPAQLSLFQ